MVFINHSLRKQTCNNLHGKKSEKYTTVGMVNSAFLPKATTFTVITKLL